MFYQLLLVVICCLCVLWRLCYKKRSSSEPPELSGRLPIVGHAYKIIGDGTKLYRNVQMISEEVLQKGGVIKVCLGPSTVYGVADPEDCYTIMNTNLEKHYIYRFSKSFLGNGLFTADASTWKKHRKLLSPAFNQQVLDGYIEVFNAQAQSLVGKLATELGKPFDHEELLRLNNLETICLTSTGVDAEQFNEYMKQYLSLLTKILKRINVRVQKFWLHSDLIYNMTPGKKMQEIETKNIVALSKSIIENKKSEKENLPNGERKGKCNSFVQWMLDLAEDTGCFTDDQIREETDTIIVGGHETTASLLTVALTVLGSYPDVQEKAHTEILDVLGNSEKNIEKDDLSKLVYVEAILKETLRLYPIFPILSRYTDRDVKLKNYTIKSNSECYFSIYGLHRHSIWGPDADQFRPERWLEKDTLPDPKYFGGFGLGRRACIGKVYAMMSMKIILAHVIRRYRISSDVSKMVLSTHVTLRPVSGHYITLELRNLSPLRY